MAEIHGQKWYSRIPDIFPLPKLIGVQLESFEWLRDEGLAELFDEISPIESYNGGMKLFFPGTSPESKEFKLSYWFEDPKHDIEECVERDLTFAAPLYVSVLLAGSEVPEPIKQGAIRAIRDDCNAYTVTQGIEPLRAKIGATYTERFGTDPDAVMVTSGVSGGEAYLHDGRARTLEEAILWHGGEAEDSKEAFRTMTAADRAALIAFLKSL